MCQPGRPWPQGLSQEGSPGLAAVHRVFFGLGDVYTGAGDHAVQGTVAELAVVIVLGDTEINVTVGGVGVALIDKA